MGGAGGVGIEQVQRPGGIAGYGCQGLIEFVAQQRGHFAHGGKPRRGLQALLRGAREFLDAALFADVQEGTHPTGVQPVGIDQRGLDDQHRKPRAVLAHEDRFEALARGHATGKALGLALPVFFGEFRRPVGCGRALPEQFLRAEPHHGAERGVDVGDAPLQVAGAQTGHQRVFHGLAKGQGVRQVTLCAQPAAVVPHQHHHHGHQGNRHGGDQRSQHVGEKVGGAVPAVHAQHQRGARQVEQLLCREHARAAPGGAQHCQPGAICLGERGLLAAGQVVPYQVHQHLLQGIGGYQKTRGAPGIGEGQAQLHHLRAQTVAMGLKIAARIGGCAQPARVGTGQGRIGMRSLPAGVVPRHGTVGRLGIGAQTQVDIPPLDAYQFTALAQQFGRIDFPGQQTRVARLKCLQTLHVARERGADVGARVGGIPLQPGLHLAGFVAPGQPYQGDQHGHHQDHQQGPQRPPAPCAAPALPGSAMTRWHHHRTRCSSAGSCARTWRTRPASSSPSTTPGPCASALTISPQGSTSMLCPHVWRPFSCTPPCAGAST